MNVDILGISELKWTGVGEFNSDDHYIYYCGQESLRRNEIAIIVKKQNKTKQNKPNKQTNKKKTVQNAVLECNLKNDRMVSVCLQGKSFNITV